MAEDECAFPMCEETARPGQDMCLLHAHVIISEVGSWLEDE